MNRALMNQNQLQFVDPPSGTLASAPAASASNLGLFYLETGDLLWPNGRLWNYRRGFLNAGTDAIVIRDSALIRNKIRPKVDAFTIEFVFTIDAIGSFQQFISLRNTAGSTTTEQIVILTTDANKLRVVLGGVASSDSVNALSANKFYRAVLTCDASGNYALFVNGVSWITGTSGTFNNSTGLITLSAKGGNLLDNQEGKLCCFKMYTGYSATGNTSALTPFSYFPLNELPASLTVADSITGVLGDITDGSPAGAIGTPMLVPYQW